jgi:hypothetical protein
VSESEVDISEFVRSFCFAFLTLSTSELLSHVEQNEPNEDKGDQTSDATTGNAVTNYA